MVLIGEEGSQRRVIQQDGDQVSVGGLGDGKDDGIVHGVDTIFGRDGNSQGLVFGILNRRTMHIGQDVVDVRQGSGTVRQLDAIGRRSRIETIHGDTGDEQVAQGAYLGRQHMGIDGIDTLNGLVLGRDGKGDGHRRTMLER